MIKVMSLQWSLLPELHDVPELDASDEACMAAIRDVLARHGKLDRFAVQLIHRHFELAEGEILVERPDAAARTQHVSVERSADVPDARVTTWILGKDDDRPGQFCKCVGEYGPSDGCSRHVYRDIAPPLPDLPELDAPKPSGPSWRPRERKRDDRER